MGKYTQIQVTTGTGNGEGVSRGTLLQVRESFFAKNYVGYVPEINSTQHATSGLNRLFEVIGRELGVSFWEDIPVELVTPVILRSIWVKDQLSAPKKIYATVRKFKRGEKAFNLFGIANENNPFYLVLKENNTGHKRPDKPRQKKMKRTNGRAYSKGVETKAQPMPLGPGLGVVKFHEAPKLSRSDKKAIKTTIRNIKDGVEVTMTEL